MNAMQELEQLAIDDLGRTEHDRALRALYAHPARNTSSHPTYVTSEASVVPMTMEPASR